MTAFPLTGTFSNLGLKFGAFRAALTSFLAATKELLGAADEEVQIIGGGLITPSVASVAVDTEAAAPSDDLANIASTNMPAGRFITLRAADPARSVTVKHAAGGSGQVFLAGEADVVLREASEIVVLQQRGGDWFEALRSPALLDLTTIAGLTALTTPAVSDLLPLRDVSAGGNRSISLANLWRVVAGFTELTDPDANADFVPVYDDSVSAIRKTTVGRLRGFTELPAVATAAGTSITLANDLAGLATASEIQIRLNAVSTNTTGHLPLVQIGPAAGVATSNYVVSGAGIAGSSVAENETTSGFPLWREGLPLVDTVSSTGIITLTRFIQGSNLWYGRGLVVDNVAAIQGFTFGFVTLSGDPGDIVLTTAGGTAAFDGGEAVVAYR